MAAMSSQAAEPEAARRLYVGNIPRTVSNEELSKMFGEHGSVVKAEVPFSLFPLGPFLIPTLYHESLNCLGRD